MVKALPATPHSFPRGPFTFSTREWKRPRAGEDREGLSGTAAAYPHRQGARARVHNPGALTVSTDSTARATSQKLKFLGSRGIRSAEAL